MKSVFDSIRREKETRAAEKENLRILMQEEQSRLERERQNARKSLIRKIKAIDKYRSQKEAEEDAEKLRAFKKAAEEKLSRQRKERKRELVAAHVKNVGAAATHTAEQATQIAEKAAFTAVAGGEVVKKHYKKALIAIAATLLMLLGTKGALSITSNIQTSRSYDLALEQFAAGSYADAKRTLENIEANDADKIKDFAGILAQLESYKGKSRKLLRELDELDHFEDEEINRQYTEFKKGVLETTIVQEELDSFTYNRVLTEGESVLEPISASIKSIPYEYQQFLDTEEYDAAVSAIRNLKDKTSLGQLIISIENIGEISLDSVSTINALVDEYNRLSYYDQKIIINYSDLAAAQQKARELELAEIKRVAAEQAAAEQARIAKEQEEKAAEEKRLEEERLAQEQAAREAEEKRQEEERLAKEQAEREEQERKAREAEEEKRQQIISVLDSTVYVTNTGSKYHVDGCRFTRESKIATTVRNAILSGYEPCGSCHPRYINPDEWPD